MLELADSDGDGRITYREFVSHFSQDRRRRGSAELRELREQMQTVFRTHNVDVRQVFAAFDSRGTGEITRGDFRDGLLSLDIMWISEGRISDLLELVDTDGDGRVSYREFAEQFGEWDRGLESSAGSCRALHVVRAEMQGVFRRHNVDVRQAFDAFDTDGSGDIGRRELSDGLSSLQIGISDRQIDEVFEALLDGQREGDGRVSYGAFAELCGGDEVREDSQ